MVEFFETINKYQGTTFLLFLATILLVTVTANGIARVVRATRSKS